MTPREEIPPPRTPGDGMLGVLARRQDETNDLLQKILDRLPDRSASERPDGTVELREPELPATSPGGEKREPAGPGSPRPAQRRKAAPKKNT